MISGGFADHHFSYWQNKGCPVILGVSFVGHRYLYQSHKFAKTDDVGIFGSPLSNEYLQLARHFALNQNDLIDLCKVRLVPYLVGRKRRRAFFGWLKLSVTGDRPFNDRDSISHWPA